jgi:thiopeptide-type bacteriocin biosynthesis protein
MKYLFAPHLLLRTPVKKPADYTLKPQSFLDDPFFRAALYLATPGFYQVIEKEGFHAGKLSEKETVTLRKYINRFCFRPTPFGLFASVTLAGWAEQTTPASRSNLKAFFHTDQAYQAIIGGELLSHMRPEQVQLEGNPSLYRALGEYRFFRTAITENVRRREYLLQSIAFSRLLKGLVTWCGKGRPKSEIAGYIAREAACSLTEAQDYAGFLADAQLLVPVLRQNLSGPGYPEHLLNQTGPGIAVYHLRLKKVLAALPETRISANELLLVNRELSSFLPVNKSGLTGSQLSVILKNDLGGETLDHRHQSAIRDGLYALNLLSPADELPAMNRFIQGFRQHFEGQTLPLLTALDPEAGIGYQQEAPEKNNPLLETLHIPDNIGDRPQIAWTAAQQLLLQSWLRSAADHPATIELTTGDLESLPEIQQNILGLSVLFRVHGEQVQIESAGGINAAALLGRFTVADERIEDAGRAMARRLEELNPELIFAELLHLSDPHTDNVNRRMPLYTYELPLTAASILPKNRQLELADLYVKMEQGKVILFSKKHGRAVIPRLSSAYNHGLNRLPLFRFLADLSYQYGRFNLGFDLRGYFPGQPFYPRVVYRHTVLGLATWVIEKEDLAPLQDPDSQKAAEAFKALGQKIKLAKEFSLTEGDQQLVFNSQYEEEIIFFCRCIRQKEEVVIREYLPQAEVKQYNAFLLPDRPMAEPVPVIRTTTSFNRTARKFLPGSEWLYLKLYAPRLGAAQLLLRLKPLLGKRYHGYPITKWFFIRYEDHAPHLRLRVQIAPEAVGEVLAAFKNKLEDRVRQQVIREFQVDVYSRELERYAAAGIDLTEDHFFASSNLVIHFIGQHPAHPAGRAHLFALMSAGTMVKIFLPEPEAQLNFSQSTFHQFLHEFGEGKIKAELDRKYRQISAEIYTVMQQPEPTLLSGSLKAGKRFVDSLHQLNHKIRKDDPQRLNYLRSIIHMHLNRLFADEARKQEMAIYYLLYKYLLSVKGRKKG